MLRENEIGIGNIADQIKKCLNEVGVQNVVFRIGKTDRLPDCLNISQLDLILSELTDNCKDCGANEITVTIEENIIRVEDGVRHTNPEEIVKKLNEIRGSNTKTDSQKWQKIVFGKVGGIGVSEIVLGILEQTGGNLKYSLVDVDRIAAEITWPVTS